MISIKQSQMSKAIVKNVQLKKLSVKKDIF